MARKVGHIIARGDRRWLIWVCLGRDHETNKLTTTIKHVGGLCGKNDLGRKQM